MKMIKSSVSETLTSIMTCLVIVAICLVGCIIQTSVAQEDDIRYVRADELRGKIFFFFAFVLQEFS